MIRRLHTFLMIVTAVLLAGTAVPVLAQGSPGDSEDNPIEINDAAGLENIKNGLAKHYKLIANTTVSDWSEGINKFTGTFDGDGYVITMSNATASLFENINEGGTVKNLGINATITAGDKKAGGIAAANKGTIQRCYVEGSITSTGVYISGIADNQGTIEDCYTTVSITTTGYYSGGIAGGNYNGTIRRCYATGAISSPGSAGIAGAGINTNSVQNCIALNDSITGTAALHARIINSESTLSDNYASPAIAGTWNNIGADKKDGADLTAANFIGKGAGEGAFTAWSGDIWDFGDNTNLPTLKGFKADQPVAGITRKSKIPAITTIATAEDLATFRETVNNDSETYKGKTVKLTADITVSDWSEPIGKNTYFKGTFDGQGHVITLTGTASLLGTINEDATIENLGVKVTLTSDRESFAGIVAGIVNSNYGMIKHCYTEGTIVNAFLGGGIAVSNYKQIQDCYSTVSISENRYGGGIVYENQGTIQRCYTTGAVKAGDIAGGIAAMNYAERNIESCIALNTSIEGTIGSLGRIAGTNGGKLTGNYASPLIAGTWSDIGADKKDGATG